MLTANSGVTLTPAAGAMTSPPEPLGLHAAAGRDALGGGLQKLLAVPGHGPNRVNDLLLLRPHSGEKEEGNQHVVFFHGDIQNFQEEMSLQAEGSRWLSWSLEEVALLLGRRFPRSHVWVVRASRMYLHKFSCYHNFVESNVFGAPEHSGYSEQSAADPRHAASPPAPPPRPARRAAGLLPGPGGLQQRLRGPEPDGLRAGRRPLRPPHGALRGADLGHVLAGRGSPGGQRDLGDGRAGAEGAGGQRGVGPRPRHPLRGVRPHEGLGGPRVRPLHPEPGGAGGVSQQEAALPGRARLHPEPLQGPAGVLSRRIPPPPPPPPRRHVNVSDLIRGRRFIPEADRRSRAETDETLRDFKFVYC
ncbi:mitochondrial protein C2orf69 homolog isoform X1 [Salarias fasciatus]|uniref:mitochondrial protein C2orf69 homolog isoform X1 n=1 Tax=Salarias fasciatus TaxID=181472 RepID=UPI00117698CA|nr:UPF0565 protein C2orf69 homolog isoform X1 [Salarias fasciatus]